MKIQSDTNLTKTAAKSDGRWNLQTVLIRKTDNGNQAIATDGRTLAVLPLETDSLDRELPEGGAIIPRKIWETGTKGRKILERTLRIEDGIARIKCGNSETTGRLEEGDFPNVDQVIPDKGKPTICVNVTYLRNLLDAIGGDVVELQIKDGPEGARSGVRVDSYDRSGNENIERGTFGVIMPIAP